MSVQLTTLVLELQRRVEALERTVTASPRRYGVLYAQAAAKKAQGDGLRRDVRAILEAHAGPRPLKAYAVLTLLKHEPRPKLRRVQQIIREIKRNTAGIAPDADARGGTRAV